MHQWKRIVIIIIVGILISGCLSQLAGKSNVTLEENKSKNNITVEEKIKLTEEEKAEVIKIALNDSIVRRKLENREYTISEFLWVLVSYEKPDSFEVRGIGSAEGLKEEEKKIRNYFNATKETMPMEILPAVVFRVEEPRPYLLYVAVDLRKKISLGVIWEFPIKIPSS